MSATGIRKPRMRKTRNIPPESDVSVKELSIDRTNKHVPLADDGSIAAPGTVVPMEQILATGALNEEAAAKNRERARIIDAKRKGQAGVSWGTSNPVELFGMIKECWTDGLVIRITRELPTEAQFQTVKIGQFASGDDMLAFVQKHFHKAGSPESTYKFDFLLGTSNTSRAVGRITLPDRMGEETPMQQQPPQPPPGYVLVQQQAPPQQPYAQPYAPQPQPPQPPAGYAPPQPAPSNGSDELLVRLVAMLAPQQQQQQPAPIPAPTPAPSDPMMALVLRLIEQQSQQVRDLGAQLASAIDRLGTGAAHPPAIAAAAAAGPAAAPSITQQIETVLQLKGLIEKLFPPPPAAAGLAMTASSVAEDNASSFLTVVPVDPNDPDGPALTLRPNGDLHLGATLLGFLSKAPTWARKGVDMAIDTQKKLDDARAAAQQPHVVEARGVTVQQQQPPPQPRRQPLPAPPPPAPVNGQSNIGAGPAPAPRASATPGFD
jgi:hypothetical protein